jgi:epoxyqueuosine reductase
VSQAALDRAGLSLQLDDLLEGARSAVVIGDGGPDFFAGFTNAFLAAGNTNTDESEPLDRYTAEAVSLAVARALPAGSYSLRFPFGADLGLPMQQIGVAAGLPAAGPLGIQIHPDFGPWWAYRALLLLHEPLAPLPSVSPSCVGCPAPCISACPVNAPSTAGFQIKLCADERDLSPACADACGARSACIVGIQHRYPAAQLAFHMRASLAMIRRYRAGARSSYG